MIHSSHVLEHRLPFVAGYDRRFSDCQKFTVPSFQRHYLSSFVHSFRSSFRRLCVTALFKDFSESDSDFDYEYEHDAPNDLMWNRYH